MDFFGGPINSGRFRLTKDRRIIVSGDSSKNYTVSKKGRILDSDGKDTGYFFDDNLFVQGLEYGTLPWMNEKAKKSEERGDYGMQI